MPLFKQSAYISPSPISIAIGNAITIPPVVMAPALEIYLNNQLVGKKNGKYIQSFSWYPTFAGASTFPTSFVFSDLDGVVADLLSSCPASITSLDCPELVYVGGGLVTAAGPNSYPAITSFNLPKLRVVGGVGFAINAAALTTLNVPELVFIGSTGGTFASLPSLNHPKLKVATNVNSIALAVATSIDFSSIEFIGSGLNISAPNCTTLSLPTLGTWKVLLGSFSATPIAFNQTTVNNILAALAYMDGTNNTLIYGTGRAVTITGTSAAPSNLGSTTTAGSSFVGAGTTCTVNWTGHGYATGDVLRVSGITTLTNANRYARITVVNANQFTYTITSQSATGAGTATVVKAAASAQALVTRGVTLTTN
jgi:hypothetical protein